MNADVQLFVLIGDWRHVIVRTWRTVVAVYYIIIIIVLLFTRDYIGFVIMEVTG